MEYTHRNDGAKGLADYFVKLWVQADVDKNGQLSFDEVFSLLHSMNVRPDRHYVKSLFEKFDNDESGTIEFDEFEQLLSSLLHSEDVMDLFKKYRDRYARQLQDVIYRQSQERQSRHHQHHHGISRSSKRERNQQEEESYEATLLSMEEDGHMSFAAFRMFLKDEQGMSSSDIETECAYMRSLVAPAVIFKLGVNFPIPEDAPEEDRRITSLGFYLYITGSRNALMDRRKKALYMDMTQPLTDYWISSSHNTYLEGDQLIGTSSVGQYISVLLQGCRCVEIDCWDSRNGPIVYHGHTLTSRIMFKDVIQCINEYAFETSEYPLILSLEMHCSVPQKKEIGRIMKTVFGDKIYTPTNETVMPSPEDLKHRIVIKAKGPNRPFFDPEANIIFDDGAEKDMEADEAICAAEEEEARALYDFISPEDDEPNAATLPGSAAAIQPQIDIGLEETVAQNAMFAQHFMENAGRKDQCENEMVPKAVKTVRLSPSAKLAAGEQPKRPFDDSGIEDGVASDITRSVSISCPVREARESRVAHKAQKVVEENGEEVGELQTPEQKHELEEYHSCIALVGKKLDPSKMAEGRDIFDICSLNEDRILSLIKNQPKEIIAFHRTQLSRIYPRGTRIDSSNFNPVPSWLSGAQVVALNYQYCGAAMILNHGLFSQNNGTGYVLKPETMRGKAPLVDFNSQLAPVDADTAICLRITILSAAQLPKPWLAGKGEVVDPFVVVSVHGNPRDSREFKTYTVVDNGFDPKWEGQVFEFPVFFPSVALLMFEIRDEDAFKSEYLASACLPVHALRPGVRSLKLLDHKLIEIPWAHLLVKVEYVPV